MQLPKGHSGNHELAIPNNMFVGEPCKHEGHHVYEHGEKKSFRYLSNKSCVRCQKAIDCERTRKIKLAGNPDAMYEKRRKIDLANEQKQIENEFKEVWDE